MNLKNRIEVLEKSLPKKNELPIRFVIDCHSEEVGPTKEDLDQAERVFIAKIGEPVAPESMSCNNGIIWARGAEIGRYNSSRKSDGRESPLE